MSLTVGTRLGPYELLGSIGAGGMGEVYRARDTKLNRDVAIKVLLPAVANDPDRLARFSREARLLASLNHPHIAQIYGFEDSGALPALVMELVEGPTLADRIARGAIPLDEALPIAKQIAEALDAAHEQGIVHRDLKPANIKVRNDGTVKVLDFGLAKALDPSSGGGGDAMTSPTISVHATQAGVILGTAAYMSPEQARGGPVDKRADLWAFGAVLYEMVTGQRAFEGEGVSDTLAHVLMKEPDWSALPANTPEPIRRLLRRCLEKDRKRRLDSAGDARLEIDDALVSPAAETIVAGTARLRRVAPLAIAALAGGAVIIATLAGWTAWKFAASREFPAARTVTRFVVEAPALAPMTGNEFDISPDGSQLVYAGLDRGDRRLFLRRVDQFDAAPLPGTEGARVPFFSPDGHWVGFSTGNKLLKIDLRSAGAPVVLRNAAAMFPAWSSDDTILFASTGHGIQRISAEGGEPRVVTTLSQTPVEYDHHSPHLLPGGQALLFTIHEGVERFSIAIQSLASGQRKVIIESGFGARYSPSGHIVYAGGSAIRAVPFDLRRLEVTGPPITLIEHVATIPNDGDGNFRLSESGSLVFQPEQSLAHRMLVWVDRSGTETRLPIPPRAFTSARVSPDGKRLAFAAADADREDIWIYEFSTDTVTRATLEDINRAPLWTSDGRRLAYEKLRAGTHHLFWQPADGSGAPESLVSGLNRLHAGAWTPDGRALLYVDSPPSDRSDIAILRLDGERRSKPVVQGPVAAYEDFPRFSPDGHWLAYTSNETGRAEIYVQAYPESVARHQVTVDGGFAAVWSRDGRELFFWNRAQMFALPVNITHGFSAGKPVRLFESRYVADRLAGFPYDVAPDGRFLMIKPSEEEQSPPRLNVALNWVDELVRRVPSGK